MSTSTPPTWFKSAVFYEVLVRSFYDADGNGTGDFVGMTEKLDYLAWLGVDCIWIPPFYTSPLRDGGYDVADYTEVLPAIGTVDHFRALVAAAKQRGIRVIIDFVMNHTSDQHPWFQASRTDPDGPYGDFYVWADDDTRYPDTRIIFIDTETSNWTWDPVRKQYFWHRFFSHQPDLNFDNPAVMAAMLEAIDFWLAMGIDGFRLDAVPYLFERDGANGENLPETHQALQQVRAFVDANYPEAVLLCEANQWPNEVVEYFGDDEHPECHMAFHFPVMPRLFLALATESARAISHILAQTPAISESCQWGIFLRNHDELTLEMVTEAEGEVLLAQYAPEPRMKANVGIRRRLAPLVGNDRGRLQLLHALLLSLPGSPVLYYGDEIGMGDIIELPDRDGVRTPMQWTDGVNAGFSTAPAEQLEQPVIASAEYGPAAVNVQAQQADPGSLLNWVRAMLAVRKQHPAFGHGTFTDLNSAQDAVLAFVREFDGEVLLCVNNVAAADRDVSLDLSGWAGRTPVDVVTGARWDAIGDQPYPVKLGPHGFVWLRLDAAGA